MPEKTPTVASPTHDVEEEHPNIRSFDELNPGFQQELIAFLSEGGRLAREAGEDHTTLQKGSETNTPQRIITRAISNGDNISRLLDSFQYTTPRFEDLCNLIIQDPNNLTQYVRDTLRDLIPILLNAEKNAIAPEIIEAIGQDNYNAILAKRTNSNDAAAQLALELVKTLMVSFGQRIIDQVNTADTATKLTSAAVASLIQLINTKVTLEGLGPFQLYTPSNELNARINTLQNVPELEERLYEQLELASNQLSAQNLIEEISEHTENQVNIAQLSQYNQAYNTYIQACEKSGITITITTAQKTKIDQIAKLIILLDEASKLDIEIPGNNIKDLITSLNEARKLQLQPGYKEQSDKLYSNVITILSNAYNTIKQNITPEKAHWFIRLLRFITQNDRLLQSEKEEKFEERQSIHTGLTGFFNTKQANTDEQIISSPEDSMTNQGPPRQQMPT